MSQDTAQAIDWNHVKRLIVDADGPNPEIDGALCRLLKMAPTPIYGAALTDGGRTTDLEKWHLPGGKGLTTRKGELPPMTGDLANPRALIEHLCPVWAWSVGSITNERHGLSPVGKGYSASLATDIPRNSTDEFGKKYFVKHSHDPVLAFWLVIVKAICDMLYDHPLAEAVGWKGRIELTGERET